MPWRTLAALASRSAGGVPVPGLVLGLGRGPGLAALGGRGLAVREALRGPLLGAELRARPRAGRRDLSRRRRSFQGRSSSSARHRRRSLPRRQASSAGLLGRSLLRGRLLRLAGASAGSLVGSASASGASSAGGVEGASSPAACEDEESSSATGPAACCVLVLRRLLDCVFFLVVSSSISSALSRRRCRARLATVSSLATSRCEAPIPAVFSSSPVACRKRRLNASCLASISFATSSSSLRLWTSAAFIRPRPPRA